MFYPKVFYKNFFCFTYKDKLSASFCFFRFKSRSFTTKKQENIEIPRRRTKNSIDTKQQKTVRKTPTSLELIPKVGHNEKLKEIKTLSTTIEKKVLRSNRQTKTVSTSKMSQSVTTKMTKKISQVKETKASKLIKPRSLNKKQKTPPVFQYLPKTNTYVFTNPAKRYQFQTQTVDFVANTIKVTDTRTSFTKIKPLSINARSYFKRKIKKHLLFLKKQKVRFLVKKKKTCFT